MKQLTFACLLAASALALPFSASAQTEARPVNVKIYDEAVFYDGYLDQVVDSDLQDGILRHRNSLYSIRLTDEQLATIGESIDLSVTIGALCDNYDRIGNINIAFVPKGRDSYTTQDTDIMRIEVARFITPFMNKNKMPDEVPYYFTPSALALALRDASLREQYDFWMEFELFGIPYAANEQVAGCAGRNDVFRGTLVLATDAEPAPIIDNHRLIPIVIKKPEYIAGNLNNYSEEGTDTLGVTTKTWTFEVKERLADARLTLIISNHGANSGGEEYIRRTHLIYADGEVVHSFKPGGKSCEPFRQYNTQANGIYGYSPRTDLQWKTSSNWCPGDIIPIREINLGSLEPGIHSIMIRVPAAKFNGKQGDFPVSMYLQGLTEGTLPADVKGIMIDQVDATFSIDGNILRVASNSELSELEIYSVAGELCYGTHATAAGFDISGLVPGAYIAVASTADGRTAHFKFVR